VRGRSPFRQKGQSRASKVGVFNPSREWKG
jgi:hypothetical protein